MKNPIVFLLLFVFILTSCIEKTNDYKNITVKDLQNEISRKMNFTEVNNIFVSKFKFNQPKELMQAKENRTAYQYKGGMFYDIRCDNWVSSFNRNRLESIVITIKDASIMDNSDIFNRLKSKLSNHDIQFDYDTDNARILLIYITEKTLLK